MIKGKNNVISKKKKAGDAYQEAVAEIAKIVVPEANVEVGVWIDGPDGRRDLDVAIWEGDILKVVIECKDWNRPIGVAFIDALDSKRHDIKASSAMICSNSGFTAEALRKAARVGIPTLSALIAGDNRIKVVVREQIYTRKVRFLDHSPTFHHPSFNEDHSRVLNKPLPTQEWTFRDKSIESWITKKLIEIGAGAIESRNFILEYTFKKPLQFKIRGLYAPVHKLDINVSLDVQWMTQIGEIGASQGLYDYLRKVVIAGQGPAQFSLKNINTQTWGKPVDRAEVPPHLLVPSSHSPSIGTRTMQMSLCSLENMPQSDPKDAAEIDDYIVTEEIKEKE